MNTIKLRWRGPYKLDSPEGREAFTPPGESGVYLWCVGKPPKLRVSYVGQAANLENRFYEHISCTLGGAYSLYSDDHMVAGKSPKPLYQPVLKDRLKNYLEQFVGDFQKYSTIAHDNLRQYRLYWALVEDDTIMRRSVESALLSRFQENEEPLQNVRHIPAQRCRRVSITSTFDQGSELTALVKPIQYGDLEWQ